MKTVSASMKNALANIETSLLEKGFKTPTESGSSSLTTGQTKQERVRLRFHGKGHGGIGYAENSRGGEVEHKIQVDENGNALPPSLTLQEWSWIDEELNSSAMYPTDKRKITDKFEDSFLPVLIQGQAALTPCSFKPLLEAVTELRILKPTQYLNEDEKIIFLEKVVERLEAKKYSYLTVREGIDDLLDRHEGSFFPDIEVLHKYIGPKQYMLVARMKKLHEMLMRRHQLTNSKDRT